jgi:hypothetical protein
MMTIYSIMDLIDHVVWRSIRPSNSPMESLYNRFSIMRVFFHRNIVEIDQQLLEDFQCEPSTKTN